MQTKEKKKVVVCVMGKSGTGKSTIINDLRNLYPGSFHVVKSFTTRGQRENDPEDIKTHEFVSMVEFLEDKCLDRIVSLYHSDKGYFNWTSEQSFSEDKINLYAIDPKACVELVKSHGAQWTIIPIYFTLSDEKRLERLRKRDNITELPEEEHLSYKILARRIEFEMLNSENSRLKNAADLLDSITYWRVILDGMDFQE